MKLAVFLSGGFSGKRTSLGIHSVQCVLYWTPCIEAQKGILSEFLAFWKVNLVGLLTSMQCWGPFLCCESENELPTVSSGRQNDSKV